MAFLKLPNTTAEQDKQNEAEHTPFPPIPPPIDLEPSELEPLTDTIVETDTPNALTSIPWLK